MNNTIWIIETKYKYGNEPWHSIIDDYHFTTRKLARQRISNARKELREDTSNLNSFKILNQSIKYKVVKFVRND